MGKFLALLFVVVAIGGGVYFYTSSNETTPQSTYNEAEDFQAAKELLDQKKPKEALVIIGRWDRAIAQSSDKSLDWLALMLEASTQLKDYQKLVTIYRHFPNSFEKNEEASILVGSAFLAAKMTGDFETLRELWKGKEKDIPTWFGLDVDLLIVDGKRDQALKLLLSREFDGPEDASRLSRLALLHVQQDPKKAWEYLSLAFKKAPKNPEIRSLRGRLMEGIGKLELAKLEYTAAARLAPDKPFYRDQLAEFHARLGQYTQAVQLWAYGLKEPSRDYIWLKALFWQSVTRPFNKEAFEVNPIPDGDLKPLIQHLLATPADEYWDEEGFQKLPEASKYLQNVQVTFWLRVLQDLKDGKEREALSLIEFNHFEPLSWHPRLEHALHAVLLYRLTGEFAFKERDITTHKETANEDKVVDPNLFQHQFFTRLDQVIAAKEKDPSYEVPEDFRALILGDEAFTAIFFAAGWLEAGLQLHKLAVIPENYPDWLSYAVTQALRFNRGPLPALEFATRQVKTPNMNYVIGQLLVSTGSIQAGIESLESVASSNSQLALRAAYDIAQAQASQKQIAAARKTIETYPLLRDNLLGQELKARLALIEGNAEEAYSLYLAIADRSSEAQSFLAKRAYDRQDWSTAKELTLKLLKKYPNSIPLRANLAKILEHLNKGAGAPDAVE